MNIMAVVMSSEQQGNDSLKIDNELQHPWSDLLFLDLLELSIDEITALNPVVTYDFNNNPVSRFNDNTWDYSYYQSANVNGSVGKRASFPDIRPSLCNEFKYVTLHLFINDEDRYDNGGRYTSFINTTKPAYKALNELGYDTIEVLSKGIIFYRFLANFNGKYKSSTLESIIGGIKKISNTAIKGVNLSLNIDGGKSPYGDKSNNIESLARQYAGDDESEDQSLYIPSNIHSKLITNAFDIIRDAEGRIDALKGYYEESYKVHLKRLGIAKQRHPSKTSREIGSIAANIKNKDILTNDELAQKYGLMDLKDDGNNIVRSISNYSSLIAASCYIILASFTGMRHNELMNVRVNGFNKLSINGMELSFIRSYETKISGGEYVDYITSPISEKAINILKKLHEPAKKYVPDLEGSDFLFVACSSKKLPSYQHLNSITRILNTFVEHFNIRATSDDVKQFRLFNTETGTDIGVGTLWKASTHQFRRTLVVNFLTHDIVGINEVKQQVKHMYAWMTEYYGKNSDLALALKMKKSKEFQDSIQEELVDINANLYKRFHYSDEHLAGKKGQEIETERGNVEVMTDEQIRIIVKTGMFKVTRTPYGYCTKGDQCDKNDVVDPTFCGAKCETMIITIENARVWQKLYNRNVKLLGSLALEGFHGAETMMKAQNTVAGRIMDSFNLDYKNI